jgi:hypothetical protein
MEASTQCMRPHGPCLVVAINACKLLERIPRVLASMFVVLSEPCSCWLTRMRTAPKDHALIAAFHAESVPGLCTSSLFGNDPWFCAVSTVIQLKNTNACSSACVFGVVAPHALVALTCINPSTQSMSTQSRGRKLSILVFSKHGSVGT